jgi:hypothetical protein
MLPQQKPQSKWPGIHLRQNMEAYRAELLKLVSPEEKALVNAINNNLDTSFIITPIRRNFV